MTPGDEGIFHWTFLTVVLKNQFLFTWFLLTTCCESLGNPVHLGGNSSASVSESLHLFTNDLLESVGDIDVNTNQVISPLSLFAALSMTSIGARGSTLSQIQQVLRLPPNALIRRGDMAQLMTSMTTQSNKDVIMDLANFLWVPRGLALKAEYAKSVQDIFDTRVRDADFTRVEDVRQIINQRIERMTRGNIKEIFPRGSIAKHTRLLLANALYFKGVWLHTFNRSETFTQPFFTTSGRSVMVPMMHGYATYQAGIFDNLGAKAILLSYQGNRYGLLCVLPDRYNKLSELENRLVSFGYTPTTLLRRMIQRDVNVTLPKFSIQFDMEMSHIFRKMGILDLFTNEADLSGMSSGSRSALLKVSSIFHQSTIEVNEGGSEATAASGFEITPLTGGFGKHFGPIEFHADHPFLFYLIDRENGNIPLIMGRVHNPIQSQSQDVRNTKYQSPIEQTYPKIEHDQPNIPSRLDSNSLTLGGASIGSEYQPIVNKGTPIRPSSIFDLDSDQVIYPKTPLQSSYYKSINKQASDRYFLNSPSGPNSRITIVFPDENLDERRFKRQSSNSSSVTSDNDGNQSGSGDIGTRLKDPLWFNKPTASEVIIPINSPESNRKPELSKPQVANSDKKTNPNEMSQGSFGIRPQFKPTLEESSTTLLSTTQQPTKSTDPPNIFHSLTPSPNPTPIFPVNNLNNGWNPNEQNIGIAPGFPPLNNGVTGPQHRPVFISPPWYPGPSSPSFQSFPLGSASGIFFPEFRFSSSRN